MNYNDMQATDVWNIVHQNIYGIQLERVAIEDAEDECLSMEELQDMGLDKFRTGIQPRKAAIVSAINEWIAKIGEGKKSIKCTDADLIDAVSDYPISGYVKNTRRVGNRISIHTKIDKARAINNYDLRTLFRLIERVLKCDAISLVSGAKIVDKLNAFPILYKLVTWEQIVAENDSFEFGSLDADVMLLIEAVWNDSIKLKELVDSKTK